MTELRLIPHLGIKMSAAGSTPKTVAVVYGTRPGIGGLGIQSANAIADLAAAWDRVMAFGPGPRLAAARATNVRWRLAEPRQHGFAARFTWLRWCTGRGQLIGDTRLSKWAADALARVKPDCCYCFTQVALETFRWANRANIPAILESPNGHLQNFRAVYCHEAKRWGSGVYLGHPTGAMVRRVQEEYARADVIRVSSEWARESLVSFGVSEQKVMVIPQRPSVRHVRPPERRLPAEGPFRVCFVGTLDLRKGFVYLLRAARRFGPRRITLQLVGGTVDRTTRRLLARERLGLDVEVTPGDPLPALHRAELFVLPTLEDGSPFVVVEAMAAGVPLLVTDQCGNASLLRPEETGWVVPAGDEDALLVAMQRAYSRRAELPRMGDAARADWERLAGKSNARAMAELLTRAGCSPRLEKLPSTKTVNL
jgi:glycosyltransferase involved in cell wall biosynthesis